MRSFVLLAFTLSLLAGCSSGPRLNTDYTSANQDSRVQFIVLHYTSTDLPHSLGILTHGGVSELDAAFKVAEKIDRARGIESPTLDLP